MSEFQDPMFTLDLLVPDNFASDAYGWVTNQMAHSALAAVATLVLTAAIAYQGRIFTTFFGPASVHPLRTAFITYCLGYVCFEIVQAFTSGHWLICDMIEDTAYSAIGSLFAVSVWAHRVKVLSVLLVITTFGLVRGIKRRDNDIV